MGNNPKRKLWDKHKTVSIIGLGRPEDGVISVKTPETPGGLVS